MVGGGGRWAGCNVKWGGQDRPHEVEAIGQRFEDEGLSQTYIWGKVIKLFSTIFKSVSK